MLTVMTSQHLCQPFLDIVLELHMVTQHAGKPRCHPLMMLIHLEASHTGFSSLVRVLVETRTPGGTARHQVQSGLCSSPQVDLSVIFGTIKFCVTFPWALASTWRVLNAASSVLIMHLLLEVDS